MKTEGRTSGKIGHRSRLRRRFLNAGRHGMCEHELLEMLLFYAIPQKDVKPLAKTLINVFGSLDKVFAADTAALCTVCGIAENSAALIKLVSVLSQEIRKQNFAGGIVLNSAEKINRYLLEHFPESPDEKLFILLLNRNSELIRIMEFSGARGFLMVSRRDIFFKVMCYPDAKQLILVHNHPAGFSLPSGSDVSNTVKIKKLFQEFGITLIDHLIIADGKCHSMLKKFSFHGNENPGQ